MKKLLLLLPLLTGCVRVIVPPCPAPPPPAAILSPSRQQRLDCPDIACLTTSDIQFNGPGTFHGDSTIFFKDCSGNNPASDEGCVQYRLAPNNAETK